MDWMTIIHNPASTLEELQGSMAMIPPDHPDLALYHAQLGQAFAARYRQGRLLPDLKAAKEHFHNAVELTPSDHSSLAHRVQNLATSLADLYHRTEELGYLEEALDKFKQAVALTPAGDPELALRLQLLASCFADRYAEMENLEDNEAALDNAQHAFILTPSGHPSLPQLYHSLGAGFGCRYQNLHSLQDLQASLQNYKMALQLTPEGHPAIPGYLQSLAVSYMDHYEEFHHLTDLESSVKNDEMAVQLSPDGDPELPDRLHSLAISYEVRYKRLGNLADLEASLESNQRAVNLTPQGDPEISDRLYSLAVSYTEKDQSNIKRAPDLESAINNYQMAIQSTDEQDPDLPKYLNSLAASLRVRHYRTHRFYVTEADLDTALQCDQRAIRLTPERDPDLLKYLYSLAKSYKDKYQSFGDLVNLRAALENEEGAIRIQARLTSESHRSLADPLWSVALSYKDLYKSSENLSDLDTALKHIQRAIQLMSDRDPNLPSRLHTLAITYMDRYKKTGELSDLRAADEHEKKAVRSMPGGQYNLSDFPLTKDTSFRLNIPVAGEFRDLRVKLDNCQTKITNTPEGNPDLPKLLHSSAMLHLGLNVHEWGAPENHLDHALEDCERAIALSPDKNPGILHTFAIATMERYIRIGDLKDIQTAIESDTQAIKLTPDGDPSLRAIFKNLGDNFKRRYRRMGTLQDLDAALGNYYGALSTMPDGHPDIPFCLHTVATFHTERYQKSEDPRDLEAAIVNDHRALQLPPEGHPEILRLLGISFIYRYERFKDWKDLERGLHSNEAAVQPRSGLFEELRNVGTPFSGSNPPSKDWKAHSSPLNTEAGQGYPDLTSRLQNLALSLTEQYEREGDQKALQGALFTYQISFQGAIVDQVHAWYAAQRWASLAKVHKPEDCLEAYSCGFKLLPEIFWVGQPLTDRQQILMDMDIATATSNAISACIDLAKLKQAVEFLDQGLATTFQQMLQLRTKGDDLPKADAEKLQHLSSELYSGTSESARETAKEWTGLIKVIDDRPGFQHFLVGPKPFRGPKQFTELYEAAWGGPVIILNSHEAHCDAIVLLHSIFKSHGSSDPIHVPLPNVSVETLKYQRLILRELLGLCNVRSRVSDSTRLFGSQERFTSKPAEECFEDLLDWLWTNIVSPIYNALDSIEPRPNHLWWCPTGAFTGLPLHAAAQSDQYIQSYTSTVSALIEARGQWTAVHTVKVPTVGLVGVTHSGPGQYQALPGVEEEIKTIKALLADKYQVQSLIGEEATVEAVKLQFENSSWLHLACHGTQDLVNPPKSHLALYEGNLELETILRMPLSKAEFVFLAACETARGSLDLVNESFHLCGGFIAAGFGGAIGTMWSMMDSDGPVVAEAVYSYLFKDGQEPSVTQAGKALQVAVRKMRDAGFSHERWMPFIHMGI